MKTEFILLGVCLLEAIAIIVQGQKIKTVSDSVTIMEGSIRMLMMSEIKRKMSEITAKFEKLPTNKKK